MNRWTVSDSAGRGWVFSIAGGIGAAGISTADARNVVRSLVWAFANGTTGHGRDVLLAIHAELRGGRPLRLESDEIRFGSARRFWERVGEVLEEAAVSGRLRVARQTKSAAIITDTDIDTLRELTPASEGAPDVFDWIGIELVDASGRPLAGRRYRVVLPDRSVREGELDDIGMAIVRNAPPGACQIECPFHPAADEKTHVVTQGEHAPGIALEHGFEDFREIWEHADNADLRAQRTSPGVLLPGDVLSIPARESQSESRATGAKHLFVSKEVPLRLRLRLQDFLGRPIGSTNVELTTRDTSETLTTDGDGHVEADLDASERDKQILLDDLSMPLAVGSLDPIDEESGRNARLFNLGYLLDPTDTSEDDDVQLALEEFQADNDLPLTGTFDAPTKSKLLEVYGC